MSSVGVNAIKTENDGVIQVANLVPKPDYTKLPEEKAADLKSLSYC